MSHPQVDDTAPGPAGRDGEESGELIRVMGPKLLLLFIVGDILGTGVYALMGKIAGEIGGAAWLPLIIAFAIAMMTALSYLELVTKYPQAGGAATFIHKAFGIHFVTFIVAFTVMCSGITSASTASQAFAENALKAFKAEASTGTTMLVALGFMVLVMLINLRGVGESVKANVVLTIIELSGLLLVIGVGFWAMTQGKADFSGLTVFESGGDKSMFIGVMAATSLAFFAMVGFEDSVNMAEETKDPVRIFPKIMITGISITGVIYILVSIVCVALVPVGDLSKSKTPLVDVVKAGAPDIPIDTLLPIISMFAVANSALINMLMASRLLYGMAKQDVLPRPFAKVARSRRTPWVSILFTTAISFGLIIYVTADSKSEIVSNLGGTTSLLLLAVFAVVNVAVLVLRKDKVDAKHFRAPAGLPIIGAVASFVLVLPKLSGRDDQQYVIAGFLLALGLILWALTWLVNRLFFAKRTYLRDPEHSLDGPDGHQLH